MDASTIEILQREFIGEEGLASFETLLDSSILDESLSPEHVAAYAESGTVSVGGLLVMLNEQNKLVWNVKSREDCANLGDLGNAILELVRRVNGIFDKVDAIAATVPEASETDEEEEEVN